MKSWEVAVEPVFKNPHQLVTSVVNPLFRDDRKTDIDNFLIQRTSAIRI